MDRITVASRMFCLSGDGRRRISRAAFKLELF